MIKFRVLALSLAFVGVTLQSGHAASLVDATKALAEAKSAISAAKSESWIWRDTEKFYKKAEKAAKNGKIDDAIKLAKKAKSQANMAVEQKKIEQKMNRAP